MPLGLCARSGQYVTSSGFDGNSELSGTKTARSLHARSCLQNGLSCLLINGHLHMAFWDGASLAGRAADKMITAPFEGDTMAVAQLEGSQASDSTDKASGDHDAPRRVWD